MNPKAKLFKELTDFAGKHFSGDDYIACVYGSYASEDYTHVSDMDMFIATKDYSPYDFEKIRDFLVDLHIRYNLNLDDEVPYENKILVTYKDVEHAISLRPFVKTHTGYEVPAVEKHKGFLSSPEIRWRLVLNALTSPNEYICGNRAVYEQFRKDAEKAVVKLAIGISSSDKPTAYDLFEALTTGKGGEEGEMYLGYKKDRECVVAHLKELISREYGNKYD